MRSRFKRFLTGGLLPASAALSLLLTACRTPESSVTTFTHPLTGQRTDVLGDNLLDTPEPSREMVWLNAYRDFITPYEQRYYLEVIYGANEETGYLDIGPGRSLTIVTDGEELNFTGLGSLTRDKKDHAVFEHARYEATSSDIERIADAKNVVLRLRGRDGIVERQFSPENIANFQKFVNQTSEFDAQQQVIRGR